MNSFVRLRQVCFAAPVLAPAERALAGILGIEPSHRAPELNAEFGLENVVFPVNGSFIEIVAPLRDNTSVSKFLSGNKAQGLYIVILDCSDLDQRRGVVQQMGIRITHSASYPGAKNIQLHPRDMGGTMLEIDQHAAGSEGRFEHFEWAGLDWRDHVRTDVTVDLLGVDMCCSDPASVVERWAQVVDRAAASNVSEHRIDLDYGELRFVDPGGSFAEGLTAVNLSVRDTAAVLGNAQRVGCRTTTDAFEFCGVMLRLFQAPP